MVANAMDMTEKAYRAMPPSKQVLYGEVCAPECINTSCIKAFVYIALLLTQNHYI